MYIRSMKRKNLLYKDMSHERCRWHFWWHGVYCIIYYNNLNSSTLFVFDYSFVAADINEDSVLDLFQWLSLTQQKLSFYYESISLPIIETDEFPSLFFVSLHTIDTRLSTVLGAELLLTHWIWSYRGYSVSGIPFFYT